MCFSRFCQIWLAACLAVGGLGLVHPVVAAHAICLNEVVSFNDHGLADEDGDFSDWIELFNGGIEAINLSGYGLSDQADQPFKWVFPRKIVPAGGFIVVFASAKDRTNGPALHASFSIKSGGEQLQLTRPDGVRVEEWPGVLLPRDYSYGRKPDGSSNFVFFAKPTPNAANTTQGFLAIAAPPTFSAAGGFFETAFSLALSTTEPGAQIYYSCDGSEPTTNSLLYTAPIDIRDRSGEANALSLISGTATVNQHTDGWFPPNGLLNKASVIRTRAFRANAWPSPVVTHTYFVFTNAARRYDLPVVSLAINTNDLFNYTTGIYVLGKIFRDYTNAHPTEPLTGHTPANYTQRGSAWERRAHLELFEPGGALGFAQDVLVDIQGQSSRSFREKSLGLKARSDAAPTDTFAYALWPGLTNRAGAPLIEFPNMRLSNSGNDWAYTIFRDALCHRLAQPTPVDILAYRPLLVFLDGEYWGVHNAREQMDPDFIENHYGVPHDQVIICETSGTLLEGQPGDNQSFLNLRAFIETNDVVNPTNYAWINTQMDVQNFIAYQATEIYLSNADWPHNNIRFWRRRTPAYQPNAPLGHDGRWRWVLFDTDLAYGHPWSGSYGDNTLAAATNPTGRPGIDAPWSTVLLRRLLLNPQFRNEFINTYADHLNSAFKENRATEAVNIMQAAIASSMPEHIRRWQTMSGSMTTWSNNVRVMRTFADQRPIYCRQHVVTQFRLPGYATLTLNVSHTNRGRLRVNSLVIDRNTLGVTNGMAYPWRGTYFKDVPVQLQALPAPGSVFAGWSNRADLGLQDTLTVNLSNNATFTALFERSPAPHDLSLGPFLFTSWRAEAMPGTFPLHMRFEQSSGRDPGLVTPMENDWLFPYNLTNRSRLNGLGDEGLAFLNTSNPQDAAGAGYLGAAVLALRTVGVTNIQVSWVGGTVAPNQQVYALRLQYAIGDGPFQDVLDADGQPVEYGRNAVAGHVQLLGPVTLPAAVNDQPYVSLRWKYYFVSGTSGPRAQLRLDDILVTKTASPLPGRFSAGAKPLFGVWEFDFVASPRRTYWVEGSTNLLNWFLLGPRTTDIDGHFRLPIERSGNLPAQFYRVRSSEP
jgi:hypothetical protein